MFLDLLSTYNPKLFHSAEQDDSWARNRKP